MIRNTAVPVNRRLISWVSFHMPCNVIGGGCIQSLTSAYDKRITSSALQRSFISSHLPSKSSPPRSSICYMVPSVNTYDHHHFSYQLLSRSSHSLLSSLRSQSKRYLTTKTKRSKKKPSYSSNNNTLNNTSNSLKDLHAYVQTHLSLDIWTINIILLTFIIGPAIWKSLETAAISHTDDDYNIPLDDPVEHSVKILMDSTSQTGSKDKVLNSSNGSTQNYNIVSPEEDAKRILNELLQSDNIRTRAANVASSVIQSEPFQNACKVLVRNIWTDLINDKETYTQLTMLVYSVLQNEKVYAAVKDMILQLVNDEEVYQELTKLVVKLGEEQEVLDATQQLLTVSAHRTMNDQGVLDHSMEFATEVVGDDVVQRTGGDALWNTVGYAVQPSNQAVLMGIGSTILAGVIYFYLSRGGDNMGGGSGLQVAISPEKASHDEIIIVGSGQSHTNTQLFGASPSDRNSVDRGGNFDSSSSNDNQAITSFVEKVIQKVVHFPTLVIGAVRNSVMNVVALPTYIAEKCSTCSDWLYGSLLHIVNIPSKLPTVLSTACFASTYVWGKLSGSIITVTIYLRDCWNTIAMILSEYMLQMRGSSPQI